MNIEIERKFLVKGDYKLDVTGKFEIKQGYLSSDPERTVRIRIADKKGFLTIKGGSDKSGMSRMEWEKQIPIKDANELLKLCQPTVISKTRYIADFDDYIVEIDEFHNENKGLVIAEIELHSTDEKIKLPEWIGEEVTNDKKYYNSYLSEKPFTTW